MPVSSHLLKKLQETLGADAADDLATWMEGMDANRGDIAELRHEMQLGFARIDARFQQVDARFEQVLALMDARFVLIQTQGSERLEKALREQTRFFYLAWAVQLAAIVGLYSR